MLVLLWPLGLAGFLGAFRRLGGFAASAVSGAQRSGFFPGDQPLLGQGFHHAVGVVGHEKDFLDGGGGAAAQFEPRLGLVLEKEAGEAGAGALIDPARRDALYGVDLGDFLQQRQETFDDGVFSFDLALTVAMLCHTGDDSLTGLVNPGSKGKDARP